MHRHFKLIFVVLAVGLLTRINSLPGSFIYDDKIVVQTNPVVARCDLREVFSTSYWHQPGYGLFRPVTIASLCINAKLLGPTPSAFHTGNLALHLLNTGLLAFILLQQLAIAPFIAMAFALLFSVHPILVEAVNSLVGRAELLVGSCFLLSVSLMVSGAKRPKPGLLYLTLPFLFGIALLSKESGIVLPPLLLGIAAVMANQNAPFIKLRQLGAYLLGICTRQWRLLLLLAGTATVVVAWRSLVLDKPTPTAVVLDIHSWSQHVIVALQILGKAWRSFFFPWHLQWDYAPFSMVPATSLWTADPLLGIVSLLVVIIWTIWRRRLTLLLWFCTFLLAIVTMLQIVPIGVIFAERLMYLPVLASCLVLPIMLQAPWRKLKDTWHWRLIVMAITIIALAALKTLSANRYWQDELNFWVYTQSQAPKSLSANLNLGRLYQEKGDLQKAEYYYRQNIALVPQTSYTYENLGDLLLQQRRYAEAKVAFAQMTRLQPSVGKHLNALALCEIGMHHYDTAEPLLLKGMRQHPEQKTFQNNLAALFITTKQFTKLNQLTATWSADDRLIVWRMLRKSAACAKPVTDDDFRNLSRSTPKMGAYNLWQHLCRTP